MNPPNGSPGGLHDNDDDDTQDDGQMRNLHNKEFSLVSPNKIIVPMLSGTNLHNKPYMPFNKAKRKFIRTQGQSGIVLLQIFDDVEKYGAELYTNNKLVAFLE